MAAGSRCSARASCDYTRRSTTSPRLSPVYYVPDLDKNILSWSAINQMGSTAVSTGNDVTFKAGAQTVLYGKQHNNLYLVHGFDLLPPPKEERAALAKLAAVSKAQPPQQAGRGDSSQR